LRGVKPLGGRFLEHPPDEGQIDTVVCESSFDGRFGKLLAVAYDLVAWP
jgi:hypothetical protein